MSIEAYRGFVIKLIKNWRIGSNVSSSRPDKAEVNPPRVSNSSNIAKVTSGLFDFIAASKALLY